MQNKLYTIVTNLKDQIQTRCTGIGDYNYDLSNEQVKTEFVPLNDSNTNWPLVCISSATEDLIPHTISTIGSSNSQYVPEWEIEMFGYVKADSTDGALPECLKLLSDVQNAILADDSLDSSVNGLYLRSSTGNYDRFGVFHMILQGSYSGR